MLKFLLGFVSAFILGAVVSDIKEGDWLGAIQSVVLVILVVTIYKLVKSRDELIDENDALRREIATANHARRMANIDGIRLSDEVSRVCGSMLAANRVPPFMKVAFCEKCQGEPLRRGEMVKMQCVCIKATTPDCNKKKSK